MSDWWWSVLDMSPSESERDVKRAYAKKLRATRPEDDAEGFQELHNAYKTALTVVRNTAYEKEYQESTPVETININIGDDQQPKFDNTYDPVQAFQVEVPESKLSDEHKQKIDELMDEVDNLLKFPASAHHLSRWRFITEPTELLDDEFRIELGRRLMGTIVVYNKTPQPKARAWAPLSPQIITMLDDTFFWSSAPFLFTNPASFEEVFELINLVDPGLRRVTAKPVGGRIVETKRKSQLKDPSREPQAPKSGPSGFQIWVGIWLAIGLLRTCSSMA